MDYEIELKGLKFEAKHGLYKYEKENKQTFVVDVYLSFEKSDYIDDDINDVVDYSVIFGIVKNVIDQNPVSLLETLAQQIIEGVGIHNPKKVKVTIHKPQTELSKFSDDISISLSKSFDQ